MIRLFYLVAHNRECPACKGRGWALGTWTGGDLLSRATIPSYQLCRYCRGYGLVKVRQARSPIPPAPPRGAANEIQHHG